MTTEITDMTGGLGGSMSADELMAKMGGKAGTFTETRADGTVVTYEMDVEEFEEEVRMRQTDGSMILPCALVLGCIVMISRLLRPNTRLEYHERQAGGSCLAAQPILTCLSSLLGLDKVTCKMHHGL